MSLVGAVQFLTRVPVRTTEPPEPAAIVPWFPVVGALVGALVGVGAAGLAELVPPLAAAATAVLAGVLVTGAFHEDGLADSADAIAGAPTRERRLEILRDSRLGTYGTAAVCGSIVMRVAAVAALAATDWRATVAAVVAVHALARATGVALMPSATRPGQQGLGAAFAGAVGPGRAAGTAVVAAAIAVAATGWWAAPLAGAAVAAGLAMHGLGRRAFGAPNGDVLGAAEQLTEIVALLVAAGLAGHHTVWWA